GRSQNRPANHRRFAAIPEKARRERGTRHPESHRGVAGRALHQPGREPSCERGVSLWLACPPDRVIEVPDRALPLSFPCSLISGGAAMAQKSRNGANWRFLGVNFVNFRKC